MVPKAIALLSGGLDSALAAKIIKNQGVEVVGLHLLSPFGCREEVEAVAKDLGIELLLREKGEAYLELLENPKYGYGANMNPCIDCRIYMFQFADKVREEIGAQFMVTGEVLGQRPLSQMRKAIDLIDDKSALEHRVLRPLSAQLFEPTLAEEKGWVNREELFKISGRGRKDQLQLAKELGISHYGSPGGGCLLTESRFTPRLKDFFDNKAYNSSEERLSQSELLRWGRHFRIHDHLKLIVGRNQDENLEIEKLWPKANATCYSPLNFQGPSVIAIGESEDPIAGQVIVRYGKPEAGIIPQVKKRTGNEEFCFEVQGSIEVKELEKFLL